MGNRQNKLNETTEVSPGLAQTGRSVSLPASVSFEIKLSVCVSYIAFKLVKVYT